jgi:AAA+ ATPase superfamily predicted ATPase
MLEKNHPIPFIGRNAELKRIQAQLLAPSASLIVIKGRRRIGKSRLVLEAAAQCPFYSFSGLAPIAGIQAQTQRDHFARTLSQLSHAPNFSFSDWSDGFDHLARLIPLKPCILLLDEISWMGWQDPSFIPKLKDWWDRISQTPGLVLIICGSVSSWIEENILNSTAFFGRITYSITLQELSLAESVCLLEARGCRFSRYEQWMILALTGGVPWYLEQINKTLSATENIRQLCFEPEGPLVTEYDRIFVDLFSSRGEIYQHIVEALSEQMHSLASLSDTLNYARSGTLANYLKQLIASGFITAFSDWSLKTGKTGKQSLYRLTDNYLRFYLRFIKPNRTPISRGYFRNVSVLSLPGFDSLMGNHVENLLLHHHLDLLHLLQIPLSEVVMDGPYIQRTTARTKGCQIDYAVQTRTHHFYLCECKFSRGVLGVDVAETVQEKCRKLSVPRNMHVSPILFYSGELSAGLAASTFFYRMISIDLLLS